MPCGALTDASSRVPLSLRVAGGYKIQHDKNAVDVADVLGRDLQHAREEAATAKQQARRLQQKAADARERLGGVQEALDAARIELSAQRSAHQKEVEVLRARAETAEGLTWKAEYAQLHQQQLVDQLVAKSYQQQRPPSIAEDSSDSQEVLASDLASERRARVKAEEALRNAAMASEQEAVEVFEEVLGEVQIKLDEALRRGSELAEELATSERQRNKEVRHARLVQEELTRRCDDWQARAEKAEEELAAHGVRPQGGVSAPVVSQRPTGAPPHVAFHGNERSPLEKILAEKAADDQALGQRDDVTALKRDRAQLLAALRERRAACDTMHHALSAAYLSSPSSQPSLSSPHPEESPTPAAKSSAACGMHTAPTTARGAHPSAATLDDSDPYSSTPGLAAPSWCGVDADVQSPASGTSAGGSGDVFDRFEAAAPRASCYEAPRASDGGGDDADGVTLRHPGRPLHIRPPADSMGGALAFATPLATPTAGEVRQLGGEGGRAQVEYAFATGVESAPSGSAAMGGATQDELRDLIYGGQWGGGDCMLGGAAGAFSPRFPAPPRCGADQWPAGGELPSETTQRQQALLKAALQARSAYRARIASAPSGARRPVSNFGFVERPTTRTRVPKRQTMISSHDPRKHWP